MTTLEEYDADLVCANDDINNTSTNGKMISRIMMSVPQNEIERTSKRTKVGLAGTIKNRLLRPKDKERYNEFTIDLYEHNAIDEETFIDIKDNYSKSKRKDEFSR